MARWVAIKLLRTDSLHPETVSRFQREAGFAGKLRHPNIVTVYEMGVTNDKLPYYTMPVVQGATLHQIVQLIKVKDAATMRNFSMTRLMQVFCRWRSRSNMRTSKRSFIATSSHPTS